MTTHVTQWGAATTLDPQSPNKNTHHRGDLAAGGSQTKLLFNATKPTSFFDRATRVGPPAPIVIEKLAPRLADQEKAGSASSSLSFSTLTEERLSSAVKLAQLDLRRRRQESIKKSSTVKLTPQETSTHDSSSVEENTISVKLKPKTSSLKGRATQTGANLLVHSPQKRCVPASLGEGMSAPIRSSGLGSSAGQQSQLSQEIHKLQKDLCVYIEKVETMANREQMMDEPLEPEELHKKEVYRRKQAAQAARIIYGLQQQVKEVQEELERLSGQNVQDTKKPKALDKLAAAHRSALRAMRLFTHQLSEPHRGQVPSHHRELGQLVRQLSLCSAKVEVGHGSAVPEMALDVLQKLQTLDSAFSKQERCHQRRAPAPRPSPPRGGSPHRSATTLPAPGGRAVAGGQRGRRKAAGAKKSVHGKRTAFKSPGGAFRSQVLRAGVESLVQQMELREEPCEDPGPKTSSRKAGNLQPERSRHLQTHQAGFRQPTVSSRLRVNQLPQKEPSVPWIPASPRSPPPPGRSPPGGRPEPRCLFSPPKASSSPARQQETRKAERPVTSDRRHRAQEEALRQAWLERMTTQRLKELNQLSQEETQRLQRLRSEVGSPTQWAERAEQKAREKIQPLLDQQIGAFRNNESSSPRRSVSGRNAERAEGASAEQPSEALPEEEPLDGARRADTLRGPTLESMLQRMEGIQQDQEEVRRRVAAISYEDPLSWRNPPETGRRCPAAGSRPASPQPMRLTRPVPQLSSTPHIVLEKPVETGHSVLSESSSLAEEASQEAPPPRPGNGAEERSGGTVVSVPGAMLGTIRRYREGFEAYLALVAHQAVGNFDPWAVADGLAGELLSEALDEVTSEFQDVCEEYAEAVFTSEFLQPTRSPPVSAPPPPLGLV